MDDADRTSSADADLLARLDALEARVARLEDPASAGQPGRGIPSAADPESESQAEATLETALDGDPFWALSALKERIPSPASGAASSGAASSGPALSGAVVFTGAVDVGLGHLEHQWGRPTEQILDADWAERAETVAALGHPVRLTILRRLIDGEHTVAQLVDELELGSTGVAYHHLSALQAGGWVVAPRRGSWTIPAARVIPLLSILIALEIG